tara:strand:+ start:621 stop:1349 length:729 start_codon:yes stop_codon:yes gene_type:complete
MKHLIKKLLKEAISKHGHKVPSGDVFLNNNIHGGPEGPNWDLGRKIDVYSSDAEFETNPIERVSVSDIVPTQKFLTKDNLDKVKKNEEDSTGAYLVKYNGKYFIIDGHHRIANKILGGADTISAYVQDIDKSINEQPAGDKDLIGYKVMPLINGEISSGANARLNLDIKVGKVLTMPGNGIYLSLNKQYVLDYYSELADDEVLITFKFNTKDITTGDITDRETELSVKKVLVTSIKHITDPS